MAFKGVPYRPQNTPVFYQSAALRPPDTKIIFQLKLHCWEFWFFTCVQALAFILFLSERRLPNQVRSIGIHQGAWDKNKGIFLTPVFLSSIISQRFTSTVFIKYFPPILKTCHHLFSDWPLPCHRAWWITAASSLLFSHMTHVKHSVSIYLVFEKDTPV